MTHAEQIMENPSAYVLTAKYRVDNTDAGEGDSRSIQAYLEISVTDELKDMLNVYCMPRGRSTIEFEGQEIKRKKIRKIIGEKIFEKPNSLVLFSVDLLTEGKVTIKVKDAETATTIREDTHWGVAKVAETLLSLHNNESSYMIEICEVQDEDRD